MHALSQIFNQIAQYLRRNSRKVTTKVAQWTRYMENKTGAVFFILGAYTDEEGGLCIARSVHLQSTFVMELMFLAADMKPRASTFWQITRK